MPGLEPIIAPYIVKNKNGDMGVNNLSIPTEHSTEQITNVTRATAMNFSTIKTNVSLKKESLSK